MDIGIYEKTKGSGSRNYVDQLCYSIFVLSAGHMEPVLPLEMATGAGR